MGRHTRRVPLFFLLLLVKLKVVYGHNVGESFILLHQGQNEKSNCALQSYENVNLTNHFLYKCKSLELFNLKYMECGSDGTCKYNWVLYEKQFWIQPAEDCLGDEILRAASKLHSRVRPLSFILDTQMVPRSQFSIIFLSLKLKFWVDHQPFLPRR